MSGNTAVSNVNIKFSDLRTKRGNESFTDGTVLGTNNISLSEFIGTEFKDDSVIPENDSISINTHFKGKTFSRKLTTDGFRAFNTWSSFPTKLTGTGSSSDSFWSGSNTSNINVKLSSSNSGELYSSLILVSGNQSESNTNKFMIVDRTDPNAIDEAEVWFKVKNHSSYNQVQFGLLKKDYDITWKQEIDSSQIQNHHTGKADRIGFHGAGFHPYSGSRDDIISSDNVVSPSWTDYTSSLTTYSNVSSQGLTTNFHNIIGVTAGTQKSSINASRTDTSGAGKTAEFNRSRHFFTNWSSFSVYNYPGYRLNTLNPSHGLKIKWYEKTIDVYLTENSEYIIPQNGGSWTNDSNSSTGLTGIFSGMYVLSVSPNSGIPVQDTEDSGSQYNVFIGKIHTNYMVMYQERGVSDLTTINATASGNVTLTLGGYLYWTLTTRSDTSSSNTNYQNPKIFGPPHTVLPRWQVDSVPTSNTITDFYQTKEWAFYIGDTTSSGSNSFEYVLRNTAPGGTQLNYSVTYSQGSEHNNNITNHIQMKYHRYGSTFIDSWSPYGSLTIEDGTFVLYFWNTSDNSLTKLGTRLTDQSHISSTSSYTTITYDITQPEDTTGYLLFILYGWNDFRADMGIGYVAHQYDDTTTKQVLYSPSSNVTTARNSQTWMKTQRQDVLTTEYSSTTVSDLEDEIAEKARSLSSNSWSDLAAGTAWEGGWQQDNQGTGSSSTGPSRGSDASSTSYYIYCETSGRDGTNILAYASLRVPITIKDNSGV